MTIVVVALHCIERLNENAPILRRAIINPDSELRKKKVQFSVRNRAVGVQ